MDYKVFIFKSVDVEPHPGAEFVGKVLWQTRNKKNQMVWDWMGVFFSGETEDGLRAKIAQFMADQQAKADRIAEAGRKGAEASRKAAEERAAAKGKAE